jgi:hypothetical protein
MEIIALIGIKGSGKTQTLNILYQFLLYTGWTQVPGHFRDLGNDDFIDVLTNGQKLLGIVTQGDYSRKVPLYLGTLHSAGCYKSVCACTSGKVGVAKAIRAYTAHTFVPKSLAITPPSDVRTVSYTDARTLLALIP